MNKSEVETLKKEDGYIILESSGKKVAEVQPDGSIKFIVNLPEGRYEFLRNNL